MAKKKKVIYNRPNVNKLKTSASKLNGAEEVKIISAVEETTTVEIIEPEMFEETAKNDAEEETAVVATKKAKREKVAVESLDKKSNQEKDSKNNKKTTKKTKREKGPGLVKRSKETISELKKVSWPKFSKVVKSTGVVITVVVFFTLVLFGVDRLLSWLYNFIPR